MPIYEYKCQSCGQISEVLVHSFNSTGNPRCPSCGGQDVERLLSVPSLVMEKGKPSGSTCCGRTERCDKPPCSSGGKCTRD